MNNQTQIKSANCFASLPICKTVVLAVFCLLLLMAANLNTYAQSALDGSTPFPVKNADFLYLFGSVQMKLGKSVSQTIPSFFLEPSTSGTTLTNADTIAVPINRSPFLRSNSDVFRIGVGVDLIKLFKKDEKNQ